MPAARCARRLAAGARAPSTRRSRGSGLAIGAARDGGLCRVPFGNSPRRPRARDRRHRRRQDRHPGGDRPGLRPRRPCRRSSIDPKGDRSCAPPLADAADRCGVRFRAWSPTGPAIYNPLARGNPTEIADKALAAHQWSEPHYELATQRLLVHVAGDDERRAIWPPTLSAPSAIHGARAPRRPRRQGRRRDRRAGQRLRRPALGSAAKADLGGGRDRLAVLADGELGPWLDPGLGEARGDRPRRGAHGGDVVYFHLDADRYPAASKLLGAALLVDLVALTAELQGDEAGRPARDRRVRRARRRAGLAPLCPRPLGRAQPPARHPEPRRPARARPGDASDTLTEQVLSNVEFAVVHRVGDPDSAERFAASPAPLPPGRRRSASPATADARPRRGTRTREREFLVGPDQFKRLRTGEAIVINSKAKRPAQIVKVWPPRSASARRRNEPPSPPSTSLCPPPNVSQRRRALQGPKGPPASPARVARDAGSRARRPLRFGRCQSE